MTIIKALLLKDLTFNLKYILLLFFCSFGLVHTIYGGHRFGQDISLFMFVGLFFSSVIIKMTYIEDGYSTDTLLKSLPISKEHLIKEKFILAQLVLIFGLVQNTLIYLFLPQIHFPLGIPEFFLALTYLELYFGLYLYLFFRFDYSVAYFVPGLFLGGIYGLYFSGNSIHTLQFHPVISIVIFVFSLFVNYLLMNTSIKYLKKLTD